MNWLSRLRVPLSFMFRHPVTSGARLAALGRFLRWQLGSRLVNGSVLAPWVGGSSLFLLRGMNAATGNLYVGLQEFEEMSFVLHLLRPGDLFVDIGANIGSYTILASAVAGAHTVAIEPGAETVQWLRRNVAVNAIHDRVEIRNIAAAAQAGTVEFSDGHDSLNHVVADDRLGDAVSFVSCDTLDHILDGRAPTVIKADVEGYELHVLRGAANTLRRTSLVAMIVETNGSSVRYGHLDSDVVSLLEQSGFERCQYDPLARTLRAASRKFACNTLMVRDRTTVEARLKSAAPIDVLGRRI